MKTSFSRWSKILVVSLIVLLYSSFLIHKISLVDDLPREISNGNMILHGESDVLTKNFYSYTEPNQSFANHHWLSGVFLYWMEETIGFGGMVIVKSMLLLSAFALLFLASLRKANFWLVAVCSIPTIFILRERTLVRPEMFSYLLIAAYLYLLGDLEQHPDHKRIYWLIPLQILWVNLHLFFGIGILLAAGMLIQKSFEFRKTLWENRLVRKLAFLCIALIFGSLLNPYGIGGAFFSLQLNLGKNFPIDISELQPIPVIQKLTPLWDDVSVAIFLPMVILLGLSFIFGFKKKEKPIFFLVAYVGTAILGYSMIRALPLFGLIFLPAISNNLSEVFDHWRARIRGGWLHILYLGGLVCLVVLGFRGVFTPHKEFGIGLEPRSNDAAKFFLQNDLQGPIFNDADIGSYLIYHLFPREKVFVDNRFGDAYSTQFFRDTYLPMMADEKVWQTMLSRYQFNVIFFHQYDDTPHARAFLYRRAKDPSWSLVYADTISVIFLRNIPINRDVIESNQITRDNVEEKMQFLSTSPRAQDQISSADIYNLVGRTDLALTQFSRVVAEWPGRSKIWMIMGELEAGNADTSRAPTAVEYLEKSISLGERSSEVYSFLGLAYLKTQQYGQARAALQKALDIDNDRRDARELLSVLNTIHPQ